MQDSNSFSFHGRRDITKKRGSMDAAMKPQKRYKNERGEGKKQVTGFSIDLNSHQKNPAIISINKNFTHRVEPQNSNLHELRDEVQQLRMENQSLRQQIKSLKSNQSELRYLNLKLQRQTNAQIDQYKNLERDYEKLQEKVKTYVEKIKQLFESLILQKRKNSGHDLNVSKVRMVLSPSNTSISNTLDLKKFQNQGYRDYFNNSARRFDKVEQMDREDRQSKYHNYQRLEKNAWSMQSSDGSPSHHLFKGQIGESFGVRY